MALCLEVFSLHALIANGGPRIASGVLTVLQTLGLFMTLMDLPLQFAGARGPYAGVLFISSKGQRLRR
jgi:hypothetical protein